MQIQEFPKMLVLDGLHCVVTDEADELAKRAGGWAMAGESAEPERPEQPDEADEADEAETSSASSRKKKAG